MICPLCGSAVVYHGLSTVECSGVGCENNPNQSAKFDWRGFLMKELTHENQIASLLHWVEANRRKKSLRVEDVKMFLDSFKRTNRES